ncbi:MAG: serine/threonine protein kinase [Armatimonadetes bacterium]|nr:serine/threonine protein kinase [Armatimonadota bacterium]
MQTDDSHDPASPRGRLEYDPEIDDLVGGYIDRINSGEQLDPQLILAENPRLGDEIVKQLRAFLDIEAESAKATPLGTLGDYTLRRQIGRGGMGVVYEAWENSMDRPVALKVLPSGIAADDRAFNRFMREARTAGKLSHPNIVPVFGVGIKERTPYFAMEFIEGETLAQLLARIQEADDDAKTPFGKKDEQQFYLNLASAFADVSDGLQHAHSRGVIHRDIKPSNLILDGDGRLRILDFGLARLEGQETLTISGDLVGTPLYMSPEQARQKKIPVDHRTDVYSLGATMYEMLCGRPPFRGKNHQDTLSQIIERDPVEARRLNARIPQDLETIVMKCLRKDPVDRYGSAEALAQDLRRFVRGEAVEARPQGRWEKVRRRIARHRRLIVTRTLIVLLLLASGALLYDAYPWKRSEGRFENLVRVEKLNSPFSETSPVCSFDGLELYFGSTRPVGDEGEREFDIWVSSRAHRGAAWSAPENVKELNSPAQEEPAWLSQDGQRLYYARAERRKEPKDICLAEREGRGHPWKPVPADELKAINTRDNEGMPSLTPDECEIYFHSDRHGTYGQNDIWVAVRASRDSPWGTPRNLEEINGLGNERQACISSDGLTLWWTKANAGEIWQASRKSRKSAFGPARLVEAPVNSYLPEGQLEVSPRWPAVGAPAYFVRDSGETKGTLSTDIFMVTWNPAPVAADKQEP